MIVMADPRPSPAGDRSPRVGHHDHRAAGGMQWSWRHAIAVGVGRGSSQGGTLGAGSGPGALVAATDAPQISAHPHALGAEAGRGAQGRWPLGGRVFLPGNWRPDQPRVRVHATIPRPDHAGDAETWWTRFGRRRWWQNKPDRDWEIRQQRLRGAAPRRSGFFDRNGAASVSVADRPRRESRWAPRRSRCTFRTLTSPRFPRVRPTSCRSVIRTARRSSWISPRRTTVN